MLVSTTIVEPTLPSVLRRFMARSVSAERTGYTGCAIRLPATAALELERKSGTKHCGAVVAINRLVWRARSHCGFQARVSAETRTAFLRTPSQ
jgi:hypothetical protein